MEKILKILLADDDQEDRYIIQDAFNAISLPDVPILTEDGERLLEHLSEMVNTRRQLPSLVVLDLNMPRLNGTETLRELKGTPLYRDIPVVIFSSSLNAIEMNECRELGALSYVVKPYTYDEYLVYARNFYEFCTGRYEFPGISTLINNVR